MNHLYGYPNRGTTSQLLVIRGAIINRRTTWAVFLTPSQTVAFGAMRVDGNMFGMAVIGSAMVGKCEWL